MFAALGALQTVLLGDGPRSRVCVGSTRARRTMGCAGSTPADKQVAPSYPADAPAASKPSAKPNAVDAVAPAYDNAPPKAVPAETKPAKYDAEAAPTGHAEPMSHSRVPAPYEDNEEVHDPDRKRSNSVTPPLR